MDDHTHALLVNADEKIRRLLMLIEQERLHILSLHPARRAAEAGKLKNFKDEYTRLLHYRHALIAEPSYDLLH